MNVTKWNELRVTDAEGDAVGTLGNVVASCPANLDSAVIENGGIAEWPQYFLHAEGEEPTDRSPEGNVDWGGFVAALYEASGNEAPVEPATA